LHSSVKIAFASGTDELNRALIERMQSLSPELPLYVVSESRPVAGMWIPYHPRQRLRANLTRCRETLAGRRVHLAGVLLVPWVGNRGMQWMALRLAPLAVLAFNEYLDSFMARPRFARAIARHVRGRLRDFQRDWRLRLLHWLGRAAGSIAALEKTVVRPGRPRDVGQSTAPDGISVVIPSRNGSALLDRLLPGLFRELEGFASEVIVVDNGSDEPWEHPRAIVERSAAPLSFARAVNRGIRRARYRYVCLLNNDMVLEPGFFAPLRRAFDLVPDLFCATAQILFPPGVRREETGKANYGQDAPTDFPLRCDLPVPGEDLSYVLYGSGGCSLYDAARLAALGLVDEAYEPAYVEDLDLGYRAWLRGWPTVFVAGARVEHRHRATTSRYFSEDELSLVLEMNYLRFLCRAVASPHVFRRLWRQAIDRLALLGDRRALAFARRAPALVERSYGEESEESILALGSGRVAVFPGRAPRFLRAMLIAGSGLPSLPRADKGCDLVVVSLVERLDPPPAGLLEMCVEIVLVERTDLDAEYPSETFRAALRQTSRKWSPERVEFDESVEMARYADFTSYTEE
jgi:GT2 family glycosyltransferase